LRYSGCNLVQKIIPFHDFNTPLTEPGQALQRALVRTELPAVVRLPAPLLRAAFPSLRSVQT